MRQNERKATQSVKKKYTYVPPLTFVTLIVYTQSGFQKPFLVNMDLLGGALRAEWRMAIRRGARIGPRSHMEHREAETRQKER